MKVVLLSICSERQMRIMKRSVLCCLLIMLLLALLGCREKGIDYEAYQKVLDEVNAEHETYFTFEQFPPNEKWDIKSYEEFAVDCAKKSWSTGRTVRNTERRWRSFSKTLTTRWELYPRMIFRPPATEDAPHRKRTARRYRSKGGQPWAAVSRPLYFWGDRIQHC